MSGRMHVATRLCVLHPVPTRLALRCASARPDTCHMLETMRDTHVSHLLPRVLACDRALEAFSARCLDCKVRRCLGVQSSSHSRMLTFALLCLYR